MNNLVGYKYGSLTVIELIDVNPRYGPKWRCQCDCGNETKTRGSRLTSRETTQCKGCTNRTHGLTDTPTYNSWRGMIDRCKPDKQYGRLGITVCKRWLSFENFFSDMGERPEGYEIDRKDPLGHYNKDNCQWTPERPNRQHRRTTILTIEKRIEAQHLRKQGMSYQQVAKALNVSKTCITTYFTGKSWDDYLPKELV